MARIRTVKPALFKHEELFDAEVETGLPLRLAFIGMWTVCDKAGRFKWKPRSIKSDVLPFDDCDFEAVLDALAYYGFIVKYEVDRKAYGCVPSWLEHQNCNAREAESALPGPSEGEQVHACEKQVHAHDLHVGKGSEGKGRERNNKDFDEQSSPKSSRDYPEWFDEFWQEAKVCFDQIKSPAGSKKKAFHQAQKVGQEFCFDEVLPAIQNQTAAKEKLRARAEFSPNFPHLERYIRDERYNDEIPVPENDGKGINHAGQVTIRGGLVI